MRSTSILASVRLLVLERATVEVCELVVDPFGDVLGDVRLSHAAGVAHGAVHPCGRTDSIPSAFRRE